MNYEREQFKTSIDWVNYRVTGRVPSYLAVVEGDFKEVPDVVYYKTKTKGNKQRVSVKVKQEDAILCNCYEDDFDDVKREFLERYDGTNFDELRKEFRGKHNLKIRNGIGEKRLEDCNLWFGGRHRSDDRLDALTYMNGKKVTVCRCYTNQEDEVREKFDSLKKDGRYTLDGICRKMSAEYNLKHRRKGKRRAKAKAKKTQSKRHHTIEISDEGLIYRDGQFVKTNKELYKVINSMI